ncbi:MAG TPA: hypothetical protein DCQ06_08745 [Myxococcales bacterium]|nr:hypothetical protein [Myxococcales bacterium]
MRKSKLWSFVMILPLIATMGCGGAKAKQDEESIVERAQRHAKERLAFHETRCKKLTKRLQADSQSGSYIPATLKVLASQSRTLEGRTEITEEQFSKVIRAGGPRVILLMARGGLGKSRLSEALTAQVCDKRAVVRVDLNWDLAQAGADIKTLAKVVEKRLIGTNSDDPQRGVEVALNGRQLLLLLDSLDEVTLSKRAAVIAAVESFMAPLLGTTAVVFTRPPVFTANYGLAQVNARLEIPTLSCAATRKALSQIIGDDERLATFFEFIKQYGLDRMVLRGDSSCRYPHLSTYRDIIVVRQIVDNVAKSAPAKGTMLSSRATIYEFLVTVSLIKDLDGLNWMPQDLISLVDRMVASQTNQQGQRNLGFTVGSCLAQIKGDDAAKGKAVCERLLQSSLFKATSRGDVWQLRNQSVGDLFLARELNQELKTEGSCAALHRQGRMLESNEVAGFLVGMSEGQRCLLPLVQELCNRAGFTATNVELLDQGLPPGTLRAASLKRAFSVAGEAAKSDVCFAKTLKALTHTPPPVVDKAKAIEKKRTKSKRKRRRKRSKK